MTPVDAYSRENTWSFEPDHVPVNSVRVSGLTVPRDHIKSRSGSVITPSKSVTSGTSSSKRHNSLVEERNHAASRRSRTVLNSRIQRL